MARLPSARRPLAARSSRARLRRGKLHDVRQRHRSGILGDLLPLAALSLAEQADHVLVQEIFDYGTYDDAEFTGVSFGFGTPPEHVPPLFLPGVLRSIWGGPVQLLADELGIQLDEIRGRVEQWTATEPIDCTMMHVDPGRVAQSGSLSKALSTAAL